MRGLEISGLLAAALLFGTSITVHAQVQQGQQMQQQMQTQQQERVFGSQLMTPGEREAYSARLRAARTEQERQRIRSEHREQMLERARQRGVALPGEPQYGRPGMGGGMGGPGGGMRSPGGMGGGR